MELLFSEIAIQPEALGAAESLFKSGRLERFSSGLYELLGKKLPARFCKQIEKILATESIWVLGFSEADIIFGGICILCPSGTEIQKLFALENISGYVSGRLAEFYTKKGPLESEAFETLSKKPSDFKAIKLRKKPKCEVLGCSIYDFFPKASVSNRKKQAELVLAPGKPLSNEYNSSENKLRRELLLNQALAKLSDALLDSDKSLEMISQLVLSTSKKLTGSKQGYVASIDPETGDNVIHVQAENLKGCAISKMYKTLIFQKGADGLYPKLLGHSLNLRKGFFTNFPKAHPASEGLPEGHICINNYLSVPAILGEELVGQIGLANSKNGYSKVELEAIKKVAALYALALQQKRASDELKYRDCILKSTFNSSIDGLVVVDINGKILFSNSKFLQIWGLSEAFFLEKKWKKLLDFISEQLLTPEAFLSNMQKCTPSPEAQVDYLYLKDGRIFEWHSTPLMTDLNLKGRVWSFRDVTSQRTAEKTILDAKLRAEEANRSKTEFLATMSHELRTPLNSIIGFSDILLAQMYGALNEKQLKYLGNISKSGKHLLTIINDILDISKVESGNESLFFEPVEIAAVFEDVKNLSFPFAASKNISLSFAVEPPNLYIRVDKIKFKQILHNLVSNALKFTPRAGKVWVRAEKIQNTLEISVQDSGIGIPKEKQELIFEPFKQVDSSLSREYAGTGLGLSLVKKFVKMHGGEISVQSEINKGTLFRVSLPFLPLHKALFQVGKEIIKE
ncbi:MAG: ATP-binding protein [Methanosarcinaceae archaeon]|nr:ATP-binding protein [Methanosarcinaceae archaeon]